MHPDEAALLKAVCAAPDDDLPRLVYADWLDEHNEQSRAEFIRTQIELAKLTRDSKRRRKLAFRCRELIDTAEDQLHNLTEEFPPEPWSFRRGFVESLEVEGMHLDEYADAFRTHPIRRLHSVNYCEIGDLKHIPAGNTLVSLDLTGATFGADDIRELARMKQFPHLTELELMCCELDDEAVRVLCDSKFFQRLKTLRVGGNPFTDAGRQRLRDHFGDRVSFVCERDSDYLYAFQYDEYHFAVGFGKDHTQVMVNMTRYWFRLAIFNHVGELLETRLSDVPEQQTVDEWLAEFAVQPATIRVKRFKFSDGVGVEDFVPWRIGVFEDPDDLNDPHDEERNNIRSHHADWLRTGQFRWKLAEMPGDDWWLNREGEVTDT